MSNDALRLINLNLKYQNFFAALIRWTKLVVSAWKKKYCPIASRCFCDKTSKVNTPDSITILHFCSYLIQIYLTAWCFWFHETLINVLLYLTIYWMYFFHYSCLKSYVCPNRRTQTIQTWLLEYLIAASSISPLQVKTPAWSWFISKVCWFLFSFRRSSNEWWTFRVSKAFSKRSIFWQNSVWKTHYKNLQPM